MNMHEIILKAAKTMIHVITNIQWRNNHPVLRRGRPLIWGTKSSRGGKKAIRGQEKIELTFYLIFLDTKVFVGGAKKIEQVTLHH